MPETESMSAPALIHRRCVYHSRREAAARCPQCGRYFCRECVTEHRGRLLCVNCLKTVSAQGETRRQRRRRWMRGAQLFMGIVLLWLIFFQLGRVLIRIPTEFHEGTVWQKTWWGKP